MGDIDAECRLLERWAGRWRVDGGSRFPVWCERRGILVSLSRGDHSSGHALRVIRDLAARSAGGSRAGSTAVIAADDLPAALMVREPGAHGLDVPGDVEFVAPEDSLLCDIPTRRAASMASLPEGGAGGVGRATT